MLWKNTDASVVANKEIGKEVDAVKTKYMVMSRNQNTGQSHNIQIDNKSFERVEELKYLENNPNKSKFHSGRN